jgi:hypothetical protein
MASALFAILKFPTWIIPHNGPPESENQSSGTFSTSFNSLPCEIVDMILHYVVPSMQSLLVCKYWYSVSLKRQMHTIQLSARMVIGFPFLSQLTLAVMVRHTRKLSILLERQYSPSELPATRRKSPHSTISTLKLNNSLRYIADRIPTFESLRFFGFYNYIECEYSWNTVFADTFEYLLKKLAIHPCDHVTIDYPGAIFETRSRMHGFKSSEAHGCDLLRFNFPDVKNLHLRMRETLSSIFQITPAV